MTLVKNFFATLIVVWLVYYLYTHWHTFVAIQNISGIHILAIGLGVSLTWIVNSIQVNLLLSAQGINIGNLENLLVQTMTILCNFLPMRIGTVLRFGYFKKVHKVEISRFGGIVMVRGLLLLLLSSTTTLIIIPAILDGYTFTCCALLLIIYAITIILFTNKKPLEQNTFIQKNDKILSIINNFLRAKRTLFENPLLPVKLITLIFIQFTLLAFRLYICFSAIGIPPNILSLMLLAPIAILLSFVTITPGNLGLREWAMSIVAVSLGYDFEAVMYAGLIDRAVIMTLTFLLGPGAYYYVWKKLKKTDEKTVNLEKI